MGETNRPRRAEKCLGNKIIATNKKKRYTTLFIVLF